MENKKIIYAVNSDLDDDLFYAEFDTMDKALKYAEDHLDKLPFIDEIELVVDDGGYEDAVSYTTVWDYTKAESQDQSADPTKKLDDKTAQVEDDFWDFSTRGYSEKEKEAIRDKARADKGSWLESLDGLVEDMEENEDMVECKECFDLFPKADCVKLAFGYICPCCNKGAEVADSDIFKIEFPEYEKFSDTTDDFDDSKLAMSDEDVARVNEPFEEPEFENDSISTPEEVIPFLVNDEVEAIAGYEKAAEVIADSDVENKEEILDILDHIKEEEEEHIEELQELTEVEEDETTEVENEPVSAEVKEVEETAEDVEESEVLVEHILDRAEPIESDQELEGTDNAVVKCKVADVITHSEDEKPLNCEMKDKPLEKPLTEGFTFALTNEKDLAEFTKLCKELGIETVTDLDNFTRETAEEPGNILDKLRAYRTELGDDFKLVEGELVEATTESEIELVSTNPGEDTSKPVKMADTASTSGMDFEAACRKYGIDLGESLEEDVDPESEVSLDDLDADEQEYIKAFTKFVNDTVAAGEKITADDIKEFRDNYTK
jgi:hypothetical protein